MIAADHDGALELAAFDHLVERQAGDIALAQSKPADARRQALKRNTFPGHVQPAVHMRVFRKELFDLAIGLVDVLRVARQGHPAKRPLALAEQRADIRGHEARSAEHPSELQSLKRNSYAVFCLKTKKR